MFGFYHFIEILIDSGFSHTCVLLCNHFEDVLLSGKFHTHVIFTKHVRFLPKWWSGTPRREPPQGFRLEDATLKCMISKEDATVISME